VEMFEPREPSAFVQWRPPDVLSSAVVSFHANLAETL